MAKDPAFLFYPNDWLGGTATMDMASRGCYISLLVAQFNDGFLSEKSIKKVLGKHYKKEWPTLQKKFIKTDAGLFFNERLKEEQEKRAAHSAKQKQRIDDYWKRKKDLLGKGETDYTAEYTNYNTNPNTKEEPLRNRDENENDIKEGATKNFRAVFPYGTDDFLNLWIEWVLYRIKIKKPFHTDSAQVMELQDLVKHPELTAREIIKKAIKNSWKNLIEDAGKEKPVPGQETTTLSGSFYKNKQ